MTTLFSISGLVMIWIPIALLMQFPATRLSSVQSSSRPSVAQQRTDPTPYDIDTSYVPDISPGIPLRLSIPGIWVDSVVESKWITSNGSMDTPDSPNEVAWYSAWVRPGEYGNAVIAGHLDDQRGQPAVFMHLKKLQINDLIFVLDDHGVQQTFKVRDIAEFSNSQSTQAIFAPSASKSLNLITCAGTWDTSKKIYTKRLVVFTELVTTP